MNLRQVVGSSAFDALRLSLCLFLFNIFVIPICYRKPSRHYGGDNVAAAAIDYEFFPRQFGGGRLMCRRLLCHAEPVNLSD